MRAQACPSPPEVQPFEGGYTRSFQEGVFRHVLHFDVASLYPSLLLHIGRNPKTDTLGVFIPLLRRLREYRLNYKQLARNAPTAGGTRRSAGASDQLQDPDQLVLRLPRIFRRAFWRRRTRGGSHAAGPRVVAAADRRVRPDTAARFSKRTRTESISRRRTTSTNPDELLALVATILPPGIELEYDGRYNAMFCYKAKNYALFDGEKITLRGSALRSRGIEPYLKKLSDQLIHFLVGRRTIRRWSMLEDYRRSSWRGRFRSTDLAKSETLSQNPDAYERLIAEGGKPRRAAAEAALQLTPRPRMGDRVTYYVTARTGRERATGSGRGRCRSMMRSNGAVRCRTITLKSSNDWLERYGLFSE